MKNPKIKFLDVGEGDKFHGYHIRAIVLTKDEFRFRNAESVDPRGKDKLVFGWGIMDYDKCYAKTPSVKLAKNLANLKSKVLSKARRLASQNDVIKVEIISCYDHNW